MSRASGTWLPAGRRLAASLALAAMFGGAGCSTLFDGQLAVVRCAAEGAFGPPACPENETCVGGICSSVGSPLAARCAEDVDCRAPASCVETSFVTEGGSPRCLLPCCTSADCGEPATGLVCRPLPLSAAQVCWPASELPERGPLGDALSGAPCTSAGDCRSGVCTAGACADTCCRDAQCEVAGHACRLAELSLSPQPTWTCAPPPTDTSTVGACDSNDDCRSGSCSVAIEEQNYCAVPCCSSEECADAVSPVDPLRRYRLACSKVDGIRACGRVVPPTAVAGVGASCGQDDECRSGSCLGEGEDRYCSDLCCDDASCGDPVRFACRPYAVKGSWALRCVRR